MKKLVVCLMGLAMLAGMLYGFALADGSAWDCPECGRSGNTGNFCGSCACPKPSTWVCPKCGEVWPDSYSVCPYDQASRYDSLWPVWELKGTDASIRSLRKGTKYQSHLGPSKEYTEGGAYNPNKRGMLAYYRENDYVLVKVDSRFVYFPAPLLNGAPDSNEVLTGYPAVTAAVVQPMLGPGNEYDPLKRTVAGRSGKNTNTDDQSVYLNENTPVSVFFEAQKWVFAEFSCDAGRVRAWIPADQVTAK